MNKYQIIKDGRSDFHIVTSQFAHYGELFAASELQKYLYQSTDVLLPYFSDRCEKRSAEICVGLQARDIGKTLSDSEISRLGEEGYLIKTIGENILIAGNTPRGTIYGVYGFLEKFLGFRCFTKDVEKIDKKREFSLCDTNIIEAPAFEYREAYFRFAFEGDFAIKNKMNANLAPIPFEKGGHTKWYNCHHSFCDLIPPKYYGETHPEYYALMDGVRHINGQPCLSNPDVLAIVIDGVKKWIKENPHCKVFSVAQNDTYEYCTCPKCREIDEREGSRSGSIITFVNKVAEEIEKEYPDVSIHTFAYMYSTTAPKYVKPRRNVIVRLCNLECPRGKAFEEYTGNENEQAKHAVQFVKNIQDWSKICKRLYIWDYAVNFKNYLQPFMPFAQTAKNIRMYKKYGVQGVLEQGNFSYGGGGALDDLKSYVIAQLLWNPNQNEQTLIDEFLLGVYAEGAPFIREYIDIITNAQTEFHIFDYPDKEYFTDELIDKCTQLFDLAKQAVKDDEIRRRIDRESLSVEYVRACKIDDAKKREKAVDSFSKKVIEHKLTEIMERINLYDSFEYMKNSRYAREREGKYSVYYIVK